MPIFYLIRHGENDYVKNGRLAGRLAGVHLNENGRNQAKMLAESLKKMIIDAPIKGIYTSPLERTIETAEPIAAALGLGILPREGLIEVDFGDWQAQKIKGLARLKLWKVIQGAPSRARFPGGESFSEAQHRICRELDQLARQHDPKDIILCVSHSDPIKLAIAYYIGLPLDLFQRLHISPGSITIISIRDTGSLLFAMNVGPSNPGILKSS